MDLSNFRKEYLLHELTETSVNKDPIEQFKIWFKEAETSQVLEPNAFSLATATPDGKPSVRVVLLKSVENGGFIFFTNYQSKKGHDLYTNQYAAMDFFWGELQRQVRIEGTVQKVSAEKSDEYFAQRPRGSQIGAVISNQSAVIASREELELKYKQLEELYQDKEIPRPENWGGFIIKPYSIEFWQGRESRLHDRILFTLENESWKISRLSP